MPDARAKAIAARKANRGVPYMFLKSPSSVIGTGFGPMLTAAFTDGETLYAVRYASDPEPPTLYTRALTSGAGMLVVSEPLDEAAEGWQPVPAQSFTTVSDGAIACVPFQVAARPQLLAA